MNKISITENSTNYLFFSDSRFQEILILIISHN